MEEAARQADEELRQRKEQELEAAKRAQEALEQSLKEAERKKNE